MTERRGFLAEWREADATVRAVAVAKVLAPGILFVVFMVFFTTFSGR